MTIPWWAVSLALLIALTASVDGRAEAPSTRLPQWRLDMPENSRIDLALNTQAAIDPELDPALNPNYPRNAPWRGKTAYAGAFAYGTLQYAKDLGQYGSIVGTIGGHNGYWGNEVVRFDIASRRFAHLSDPYSSISHPGFFFQNPSQQYQHSDRENGELFIDSRFNTDQSQPTSFHSYASNVVLPPDASTGVGTNGALITPVRAARTPLQLASPTGKRTHIFDLAQSNRATAAWRRFATNLFATEEAGKVLFMGWAAYDPTRRKIFAGIEGAWSNQLKVLNAVTRQWETPLVLTGNILGMGSGRLLMYQHIQAWHWSANPDYLIVFRGGEGTTGIIGAGISPVALPWLILINLSTGQCYLPGTTGTAPKLIGGADWVQSSNKMALYEGGVTSHQGERGPGFINRVWILTPPSTTNPAVFTTTPWVWTFEEVTGATPPVQTTGVIPHAGRFVWADKVKAFIWWANGVDNVQAWRVRGFF